MKPVKQGRPTKFTPDRIKTILDALREGNYRDTAAEGAGISYDTLRNWEKKGAAEKKGKYFEFSESIKRAEAEGEQLHRAHRRRRFCLPHGPSVYRRSGY